MMQMDRSSAWYPKLCVSAWPTYSILFLAVHTSLVEPLPHQITAVYEEMLTRQPLIRVLLARGDLHRCLVGRHEFILTQASLSWKGRIDQPLIASLNLSDSKKFASASHESISLGPQGFFELSDQFLCFVYFLDSGRSKSLELFKSVSGIIQCII